MIERLKSTLTGMLEDKPHLFSPHTVVMSEHDMQRMEQASHVISRVLQHPDMVAEIMPQRPDIAAYDAGNLSAMIGYDFHITPEGPKLIEINTNAGGLMTSTLWRLRHHEAALKQVIDAMVAMFQREYEDWFGIAGADIHHIAIVDRNPDAEFTLDDFVLTKIAFEASGIIVSICATHELTSQGQHLYAPNQELPIDLVYNRSCDFYFEEKESSVLKQAYMNHEVCVTPNPYGYGLLSDKRTLVALYQQVVSEHSILTEDERQILQQVLLPTYLLADDVARFSAEKSQWFFKHVNLHAGQEAFRGNKLSRKLLEQFVPEDFIVQKIAKPGVLSTDAGAYKYDMRVFTHQDVTIEISARLYQGRITNFRTEGGGYGNIHIQQQDEYI